MKYFFEAGMGSIPVFLWQELPLKHPERAQDVRWTSALRGPEWNGDAAARCRRQRSMGIGEFPQQAENRFHVTKALLAEEWVLKKSFKIWKNYRLILFVSWSRI